MKRAVAYLRVSTEEQTQRAFDPEGYSIPAQRTACHRRAAELEADIEVEFVESESAWKSGKRPQFAAMIAYLQEHGPVDIVLVHKLDRFSRNVEENFRSLRMIQAAGAILVSVSENIDDTPSGFLQHGMLAVLNEYYSRNLSTEIRKGLEQKVQQGGSVTLAPLGYLNVRQSAGGRDVRTVEVDPDRAPLVTHAFEAYATGNYSLSSLLHELTMLGLRTRATPKRPARPLALSKLATLLHNPYYRGVVLYKGLEHPGKHERLVSDEIFEQVQRVLAAHTVSGERSYKHHHYLKGTVFCRHCRERLGYSKQKNRHGREYWYFWCANRHRGDGCLQRYVDQDNLEDEVVRFWEEQVRPTAGQIDELRAVLAETLNDRQHRSGKERERQERRLAALRAERFRWAELVADGSVPRDVARQKQADLARDVADAESTLEAAKAYVEEVAVTLSRALDLAEHVHQAYRIAPPEVRRQFNQAFFTTLLVDDRIVEEAEFQPIFRIILDPATPARLRVNAKHPALFGGQGANDDFLVEVAGIEPASFSFASGLLRAQPVTGFSGLPLATGTGGRPQSARCPRWPADATTR